MNKLKHVQLYENFGGGSHKVITVFMETEMAVGFFPSSEADSVYSNIDRKIASLKLDDAEEYFNTGILDLPGNHDLVVVPFGGMGSYTTNIEELDNSNDGHQTESFVELGKDYDYESNPDQMVFKIDKGLDGFIVLDSSGQTRLESSEEIEERISYLGFEGM